jgi:hypothetical protein
MSPASGAAPSHARDHAIVGQRAHAAQHAACPAPHQPDFAVALNPEGAAGAFGLGFLGWLDRKGVPDRAIAPRHGNGRASGHKQAARASRGVQMVAPRSIMACAKSPARASGVACPAQSGWRIVGRAPGSGSSIANRRAMTRSTLASTTLRGARTLSRPRQRRYRHQGRAARAASSVSGKRRPSRPRRGRRPADCAPGHNSQARPMRP